MIAKISDITSLMECFAPLSLAEEWDNAGLQVGHKDWPVRKILVALDPALDVVAAACKNDVDLLITHHPLIFKPLKSIDFSTPVGSVIQMAVLHKMAVFAAHSNLDSAADGVNDVLARRIGIKNLKVLGACKENGQGLGRIGELEESTDLFALALKIKKNLGLKSVKVVGKPELEVKKVAVCSGSGSGMMEDFFSSGAQVYISGDLRYHDARNVEAANLALVDIGHFESEHLIVGVLQKRLQKELSATGFEIKVEACGLENSPFIML
jgi:dinuclear metal center YbgI/SA1388 family protein